MEYKKKPKIGEIYYHYKGGNYRVIKLAKHSETDEDMVVYESIEYGSWYVRPLSMWFDSVTNHEGINCERFVKIVY